MLFYCFTVSRFYHAPSKTSGVSAGTWASVMIPFEACHGLYSFTVSRVLQTKIAAPVQK